MASMAKRRRSPVPLPPAELAPEKEVTIYIGGVHSASRPELVKTLLGSCIAVCLFDPLTHVGGMNHFMLPTGGEGPAADRTRFGVHAMDCLIGTMVKLGAHRRRLVAKLFGGAHVLDLPESVGGVPQQNVTFIRSFLAAEGLPILAEDVGGYSPRHVRFHTYTGRAQVKRVEGVTVRARLLAADRRRPNPTPTFGDVELFD
jgi:chemotaxis receptor (MCP) glutamine deamidase CheD